MTEINKGDRVIVPGQTDHDGAAITGRVVQLGAAFATVSYDAPHGNIGYQPAAMRCKTTNLVKAQ